jgi:O-antigen/teichoic acid export membrane protein
MPNFKRNILSVYSVNVINGILGIIFVPLSLKLLGADGYGLFSIYGVLASFIALIDLGVGKNLLRLLAADDDGSVQREHLQNAFGIYLSLSGVLMLLLPALLVIIPVYLFPVSPENTEALRWIVLLAVVEYILAIPVALIQSLCIAKETIDRYSAFNFVSGISRYALMFSGILIFRSPEMVVALVVGRRLIDFFTASWLMGALPKEAWHPKLSLDQFTSIIGHSTVLSTAQILQSTVIAIGSILVNRFFGLDGLGKYRAAFDLSSKVWFFSNGVGLVVFPKFVKKLSGAGKRQPFFATIYRLMNASWAGFNLLSVAGTLCAPFLFKVMHIQDREIAELFVILLLGICLNAHANLSYELLQATGKYKLVSYVSALSLTLMVISFYGLKRELGIHAIAWAWIISQAAYSIVADVITLSVLYFPRNSNIEMLLLKLAIFLVSLSMLAVYFAVLPQEFKFFPAIFASMFFIFLTKTAISRVNN